MNHLIYQDNTFDLIERQWQYDINKVTCYISKNSISFSDLQEFFPIDEVIDNFTLEYDEEYALEDPLAESPMGYTVVECEEESDCYKLAFQYEMDPPITVEQLAANIDYLATMMDIDLEE